MNPSDGHAFGQEQPPLYVAIQKILDKYPNGQIFKEIIQNADDAGASTVHFYLDNRQHRSQSLINPSLAQFQGPALLSYNDAVFQDKDWESITKMQQSVKAEDPFKIGKFGIGFNSVYHITDLPTILSGNRLAYFEPHEEIWPRKRGRWYDIDKNAQYSDIFAPFEGLCGFSVQNSGYNGTLFRFPLRSIAKENRVSSYTYNIADLRNLLVALREEAKCILLFLRSVRNVEVYEIGEDGTHSNILKISIAEISNDDLGEKRSKFKDTLQTAFDAQSFGIRKMPPQVVHVEVKVDDIEDGTSTSKWLVANQVGSESDEVRKLAKDLKVFPWVGVALETSAVGMEPTGGRVFCVLPMPPGVTCKLPVHVNGMFSLNDERRELKWQGIERKNDPSALWNHLLVRELLPPCYAMLLLDHAKLLLEPDQFCLAWPDTTKVEGTHWADILAPLLRTLFSEEVIPFSKLRGFQWIKVSSAVFVPREEPLSEVVSTTLLACGVKLVAIVERIWNALLLRKIPYTTASPSLARKELREKPESYKELSSDEKYEMLHYCLSDNAYKDLHGLELLPLVSGGFATFDTSSSSRVYLCSKECPHRLLPTLHDELVDENIEGTLYAKLSNVANEQHSNLHVLTSESVAELLKKVLPQQTKVALPYSNGINRQWLETFWQWVRRENLHLFQDLPLVPVCGDAVVQLSKKSSTLFIHNTQNYDQSVIDALEKLGVECCQQKEHSFVGDPSSLMNTFSPEGILDAIHYASPPYDSISLTKNEAIQLITHVHSTQQVNPQQQTTLIKIPMFATLKNTEEKLYSVVQVEKETGRKAQMKPTEFPINPENLPRKIVLFSDSDPYQNSLLQKISIHCTTTTDLLIKLVFPMIEDESMKRNAAKKLMVDVLDKYHSITSSIGPDDVKALQQEIAKLPFVPVSSGKPKAPNTLYSPLEPELKDLFAKEPVFPTNPFCVEKHIEVLKSCGLKTNVSTQEVTEIICSVGCPANDNPVKVDKVKQTRARAILTYIKKWDHELSEIVCIAGQTYHGNLIFLEALKQLSITKTWLPIQSSPPPNYPPCLSWKGMECNSHLVSFASSVLLHEDQTSLALACGSQMYFVEHSLPNAICKTFEPSPKDMIRHIMAHLERVILSGQKIEDIRKVTHTIYEWLNKYRSEDHTVDLSHLKETQECVWLNRQRKFVNPHNIALKQNDLFQHNLEPFIYILPDNLAQFESLFKDLGIQENVTSEQILRILSQIKEGDSQSLRITSDQAWQLVMAILHWLTDGKESEMNHPDSEQFLVPVQSSNSWPELVVSEDAVYTDNDFLRRYLETSEDGETEFKFVHDRVTPQMSHLLKVTPLSKHLEISEDAFEDVGQSEPLTVRLKNILKDYKDGLTIIKELLQNADDAGATEMNICHDKRYHTDKHTDLFFPGMANCHGPALVVNNNAMFTKEDFMNITKLAGATKEGKSLKIGKFGIGFCSVYHITDIPSFVSSDLLYIFDPTLMYLKDEIKNPAMPGKKVCFTSRFIRRSKQLDPYVGLYGFDPKPQPKYEYEGTTFRFPFRTGESELSENMYTENEVKQLMQQMLESSSKLILFLQKIKSVTFSQVGRGEIKTTELMRIMKCTEALAEGRYIEKITCSLNGSGESTEYWLVETSTETVLQKYSTASVACSLSPLQVKGCYKTTQMKGEVFCFLPLSITTGLPVHVSSNFAVISNRRGIWTSDESDATSSEEVDWNVSLMKTVICSAYCRLLEALRKLQCDSKLEEYDFFSMWPVEEELQVSNPWHHCVTELYRTIAKRELFFSVSTNRWLTLEESIFLDPNILRVSYNTPFPTAVLEIVNHIKLPVVHLPKKYHKHLDLTESIETEKMFLEHFFDSIDQLESIKESRNDILCLALKCYANELAQKQEERYLYLHRLLTENACVPCAPDGEQLKKANDLIHPEAMFAKLFDEDENMFPLKFFCDDKVFVDKAMKELGMLHDSIPLDRIEERATGIAQLYYGVDEVKAMERAQIIIKCLVKEDERETLSPEKCSNVSRIPFLPVMEKPENYMLQWKGHRDMLHRACDIFMSGNFDDNMTNTSLAGSQLVFLNQESPSTGGCGIVGQRAQTLLQIRSSPSYTDVISHFHHMIDEFDESQQQMIELAGHTSKKVYAFLEKHLASTTTVESKEIVAHLMGRPFIWTGKKFVGCKDVALDWNLNGPHLFQVPIHLKACVCLVNTLDIRPMFSLEDMITALKCVKEEYEDCQLPPDYQELVKTIVPHMPAQKLENDLGPIMLPDADFIMQEAKKLHHNDMPWTEADEEFRYVHEMVPLKTALALGVKRCRSAVLGKYSSRSGFKAMAFGQHEELTRRIQNIIRDYPFDMTILKELLQNADDAKATKMHVILDMRQHSKERLLSDEWSDLQGPALLVWNDSVFTEEDLEGIQHLGLGSKRSDSETIGQYGIGFNAVYHLTDCPSFLTGGDKLCILDPHMRYVEEATERHPGEMYVDLDDNFWRKFAGIKSTYLQEDLVNKPDELLGGTLFRFPLRHTPNHVKESKIVNDLRDSVVLSAEKMHTLLEEWAPSMKQSLLFLNHVTELKFSVIRDTQKRSPGELHLQNAYRTELDETAQKQRLELTRNIKLFGDGNTRKPFIATYSLAIESQLPKKTREKWLIQQGIGDVENSVTKWSYVEQVKPRHGIAAPLKHEGDQKFSGQVFCFLPLPLYSGLPVHINGHFILNSTRRNLWAPTDPGREDSKSMWNRNILQAIAASYAHFLERIHKYFPQLKGCAHREALEESVKEYYACFPRTHLDRNMLSEPWLTLAKQVFQILFTRNSPVLAVPTKMSSSEDKYLLQWRPPKSRVMPVNQVYFPEGQIQSLVPIFERIGMKITCAPKWIRSQFNEVNCKIPAVSQSSVYDFYIRFHTTCFPQPIQDTPFRGVEDFKSFTKYLLNGRGSFPKEPFGYPLLLTAAEQLCVFDKGNKILCSKHLGMFPSCKSKFLHPDLIECSYSPSYFVSEYDHKLKIVKELLETILPTELKSAQVSSESNAMTKFDMKGLWKCFSDDKVFRSVVEEVLKVWALLLTKDKRLFQCRSRDQLLPIIVVDVYPHKAVVSVLEQIQAPILDTSIVPVDVVHSLCPNLNDHKAVLNDLVHFYKEFPFFEVIKKQSAGILIDYFSKIYLRREQYCCQQLKCLPLFEKMDGQFTILHGKTVYVWPTNICQEGNELWLSRTNCVFLSPSGAWTHLGVESELGIKRITAEEAYLDFIFPHFSKMCKKDRYHHLKYIRDHLFRKNFAQHDPSISPFYFSTPQNIAYRFIANLKTLQCIGDDGEAKPVSHFYTHEKPIFQTFPEHFQTLPKDLLQKEEKFWMPFFKKIGLKDLVNTDKFVVLCTYVAGGKLKEKTATGSKVLLNYLLSFEEANHHRYHQNVHLLRTISLIPFVCPVPVPELEWIHKVPATPNRVKLTNGEEVPLCTLSGSCLSQHRNLLWATKSVVEIPYCQNGVLQNLGICVKPTAKDLMESIGLIAKTCFTNPDLFMKYTAPQCKPSSQKQLMDVMVEIFMHMEQFQGDITELKFLQCIPVYAILNDDSGQYPVLVEPRCVVFRPARDTTPFYPYLHCISSPLYKVKGFLERVGVKDSLELEHMQLVLQSAFTVSGSGTIDMEPNTLKVVSSAVVGMKALLEKNKSDRQQMGEEVLVEKLKPLYLSGVDKRMHAVHSLVYSNLHNVNLEGTDLYQLWTPKKIFPASLCELLPKALRPRSLPELCFSKVSESCKECENVPKDISEIKRSLNFPSLQQALYLAGKSNISRTLPESKQQKLSEKFQAHIAVFFETLEIHCVENLKVDMFLKDSKITKPVAHEKVKCIIQIEITTQMQQVHHLYIDSNIRSKYVSEVHECVASQLLSCLYGDIRETELEQLNKFMSNLIGAESPEEIYSMLQNKQINATEMDMTIEEPRLGDKVPKSWHYRLDMSIKNIFQSQEWVAYEPPEEENTYIFAQISHPVRLRDLAGEPLPPTHMEYIIFISENSMEEKTVRAIDLYKFIRGETAPDDMIEPAPSESQEIVPFEGDAEEVPPPLAPINVQQAREEVRKELEEIWRLPQADRKTPIRRLFFKWHPDKHPHNPELAEEVFKFIQNELDRLERGDGVSASNSSGPYKSWRSYWHTWNFYARQHRQYYQQQRKRNRGGGSSGWGGGGGGGSGGGGGGGSGGNWYYNRGGWGGCWFFSQPFMPPKNEAKAKQWVRQATADHTVLQLLLTEAHGNAQVCGSVCFMAHEVAEKALKGAMYVTCGLGDKLHASHNIIALANSVELMEPRKAGGLSTLAQPLESTYYEDTRFPKQSELCPPYEKFTLANAMEAEKCATEILKIVRDNIVNI